MYVQLFLYYSDDLYSLTNTFSFSIEKIKLKSPRVRGIVINLQKKTIHKSIKRRQRRMCTKITQENTTNRKITNTTK